MFEACDTVTRKACTVLEQDEEAGTVTVAVPPFQTLLQRRSEAGQEMMMPRELVITSAAKEVLKSTSKGLEDGVYALEDGKWVSAATSSYGPEACGWLSQVAQRLREPNQLLEVRPIADPHHPARRALERSQPQQALHVTAETPKGTVLSTFNFGGMVATNGDVNDRHRLSPAMSVLLYDFPQMPGDVRERPAQTVAGDVRAPVQLSADARLVLYVNPLTERAAYVNASANHSRTFHSRDCEGCKAYTGVKPNAETRVALVVEQGGELVVPVFALVSTSNAGAGAEVRIDYGSAFFKVGVIDRVLTAFACFEHANPVCMSLQRATDELARATIEAAILRKELEAARSELEATKSELEVVVVELDAAKRRHEGGCEDDDDASAAFIRRKMAKVDDDDAVGCAETVGS